VDVVSAPSLRHNGGEATPRTPKEEHFGEEGVIEALHKMDLTGLLFFAGVLFAVAALNTAGVLSDYAELLVRLCGKSPVVICSLLGISSAVVDNVPLVEAAINMFDHPQDDPLWQLVALAAGTGGSILSVGSIAGVTLMTMEGVGYLWYCRDARASNSGVAESDEASCGSSVSSPEVTLSKVLVLVLGIACIFMVPILKMTTGLPPYMGMLLALGIIWFVTDTRAFRRLAKPVDVVSAPSLRHNGGEATPRTPKEEHFGEEGVIEALHKMDLTGLLFFAGVLFAVAALNTAGVLSDYAELLVRLCGKSPVVICSLLGISSAVVDNVPLVEAAINMFDHPQDDPLWQLVALAAGTGGSILSVGSIAGVTLMTMEGVGYLWYCRRVSFWAVVGFACGIATYQLERQLFG